MKIVTILSATIVILLPCYLIFLIVNDILLKKIKFFRYFEQVDKKRRIILPICVFLFVICLWTYLSYSGLVNRNYLPTPGETFSELYYFIVSGSIFPNIAISLYRILIGFGLASIIGVLLGSLAGTFARIRLLILPINSTFRYIPPTAFISLTIIWFGIGETGKIALIFIAIIFYITQMVADVVNLVPKTYVEAAQMLGANRFEIFRKVVLSYTAPDIIAVLRVNLGAAWTFLIVSELVAAQKGLGHLMATSQRFLQTPKLFALIFIVGVLGFLSDALLAILIKSIGKWRH